MSVIAFIAIGIYAAVSLVGAYSIALVAFTYFHGRPPSALRTLRRWQLRRQLRKRMPKARTVRR